MSSQRKSSVSLVLCLAAIAMTEATSKAPFLTRHRRSQEFARRQSRNEMRREMEDVTGLSLPLEEGSIQYILDEGSVALDEGSIQYILDVPLTEGSIQYYLDEDMSLQQMEMDLSIPSEDISTETHGDELGDTVSLGDSDSNNAGSSLILASFLAGISALLVGAAALFVKMRRVHGRQAESQSGDEVINAVRMVSFASIDGFHDAERGGREIVIA
ncbi:hypothetical protein ACHAWF_017137 [Thalassiosira exigua]